MSEAAKKFLWSIKDAEVLMKFYSDSGTPPKKEAEVLKRAGLVMALTAWETYVEDRVGEVLAGKMGFLRNSPIAKFVQQRFDDDLKRFNNPNTEKTRKLFLDYLFFDVTQHWEWSGYEQKSAATYLNALIKKRGDAVHRSKDSTNGPPTKDMVSKDELVKAIQFLKDLVESSEQAIAFSERAGNVDA